MIEHLVLLNSSFIRVHREDAVIFLQKKSDYDQEHKGGVYRSLSDLVTVG